MAMVVRTVEDSAPESSSPGHTRDNVAGVGDFGVSTNESMHRNRSLLACASSE